MALTTQDFDTGVDFTGLANVTGADLNNGVNLAIPHKDDANSARGLVVSTKDSAIGVPVVPDANTHVKWKQYIWERIPFAGASSLAPILYGWNEDTANDATYQKWLQIEVDFTDINNAIAGISGLANIAKTEADQAIALAQAVNTVANNAATAANTATTTANNASTAANAATAVANTASANAALASTAANAATATANATTTALATYQSTHKSCFLAETTASGVNLPILAAGVNHRNINSESDPDGLVTLAGGKIVITNAGTYEFDISVPCFTYNNRVQAFVVKDSDGSVLIFGQTATTFVAAAAETQLVCNAKGFITATAGMVVRIDLKALNANGYNGFASGFVATTEVFTVVAIRQVA